MDRGILDLKRHLPSTLYIYIYIELVIKFNENLSLWKSALDSSFDCFAGGGPSSINGIFAKVFADSRGLILLLRLKFRRGRKLEERPTRNDDKDVTIIKYAFTFG